MDCGDKNKNPTLWMWGKIESVLFRESNPGPPAPEAGIIPLDQTAACFSDETIWECLIF